LSESVPVVVIHNPVDTDRFVPDGDRLDLDALSGLPPAPRETIRIGLPATFARWKGHDTFLRAVAQLGHPKVRAYIIGGPVYQTVNSQWSIDELRQMVAALHLEDHVGFTGVVDDMPRAYRSLDIVVHASTRPEPFGLVIAEAMACGRALVAAPAGGAGELFVDGVHAVAAPGGDVSALASALDQLISDPARRAALSSSARRHAATAFALQRFSTELEETLGRFRTDAAVVQAV
jgi:glycosyltransferase involved in cell wall biosynthesis